MSSKKAKRKREYLERERKRSARKVFDVKYPQCYEENLIVSNCNSIEDMAAEMGIKLK